MAARHDLHPLDRRSLWRENHGNLLLAFAGAILLTGLAILAYRQWNPPRPHVRQIRAEPNPAGAEFDAAVPLADEELETPASDEAVGESAPDAPTPSDEASDDAATGDTPARD